MTTMPEVGQEGLERLQSAHVVVVGVGGVGGAAAYYLAKQGVGYLRLIDQDIIEPSNLHRLHGATREHLYHPKADVAAESLARDNPWTHAESIVDTLRTSNVQQLLSGCDLIVDGLDNFRTRYVLNQYSRDTETPYLFASAIAHQGHLALFNPPETACLDCLMPNVVDRDDESCENLGVAAATVGLVGAIAASQASNFILASHSNLKEHLLTFDTMTLDFVLTPIPKRAGCETCSNSRAKINQRSETVTVLCGGKSADVLPDHPLGLDLQRVSHSIPNDLLLAKSETVLVYKMGDLLISLFRTGRMRIEGVRGRERALEAAKVVWELATTPVAQEA